MVKQIFVFSDMQFDDAHGIDSSAFETDFGRIKRRFAEHGYELPKLIFWNLASGNRYNFPTPHAKGFDADEYSAPKPVTKEVEGTMIVGGYSQAMMKMFLEDGTFGALEEEVVMDEDGEDGVEKMGWR